MRVMMYWKFIFNSFPSINECLGAIDLVLSPFFKNDWCQFFTTFVIIFFSLIFDSLRANP